jgi:hypothetical protein
MIAPRSALFALIACISLDVTLANAQALRLNTKVPKMESENAVEDPWEAHIRYSVFSDFADDRQPRSANEAIAAELSYHLTPHWSVSSEIGAHYETINGQIDKDPQETYTETLNPSWGFELDYENGFLNQHNYTFFVHGEPLFDQPSRLEGYEGIVGGGGEVRLNFFNKRYTFANTVDVSDLLNTYKFALDTTANPNVFMTYKMTHSVRIYGRLVAAFSFGLKTTEYTDGFIGYDYVNSNSLSMAWTHFRVSVSYENGGYTEDGDVSLWYIDEYRRIGKLSIAYIF